MKALLSVTALSILTTVSVYSQTQSSAARPCALTVAKSPAVRGVKLGMKTEDLLALFPGSAENNSIRNTLSKTEGYPHFGVVGINIRPEMYSTKERFTGIVDYSIYFVDGRVGEYRVQYIPPPSGPKWQRVDDFVTKIAQAYQLPPAASWTSPPDISYEKTLKCDGFQLKASAIMSKGVLTVSTTETPLRIHYERQTAFEENIRRGFKP